MNYLKVHARRILAPVLLAGLYLLCSLFRLESVPPGVNNDEAVIGYDAYSIWTTGRDHWGHMLPIEFQSFGDYKLPVYPYISAPIVGLLGLSVFSVRLTAVLGGLGCVLLTYVLGKKMFSLGVGVGSAGLLAVTPYFFGMSRMAVECSLALFFILLGTYLFLITSSAKGYFFSAIALGLSLFTYHSSRVLVPFIVLALIIERFHSIRVLKAEVIRNFRKEKVLSFGVVLVVLLTTCLIGKVFLVGSGGARLTQIGIFKNITILDRANMQLGSCRSYFYAPLCKVFDNRYVYYFGEYIHNYLSQFSLNFLFLNTDNTKGMLPSVGYFLISMIPMLCVGVYLFLKEFKNSKEGKWMLVAWILSAPLGASLAGPGSYSRSFIIVFPLAIFSGIGLNKIFLLNKKCFYTLIVSCAFEAVSFLLGYFSYFPNYNSSFTHYEYQPLVEFMGTYERNNSNIPIYISSRYHDTKQYIFYLFYQRVPPIEFQHDQTVVTEMEQNGWIWVKQVKNWHFVRSIPSVESLPNEAILVGSQKEEIEPLVGVSICPPYRIDDITTIRFLNGDPAFEIAKYTREKETIACDK